MKVVKFRKIDTCFGLPWSTLICLGLLALSQITIERLKCSKAISGIGYGYGMGWDGRKSLKALILRAPLCGANNGVWSWNRDMILRDSQKKWEMSLLACQRKKLKACWVELEDLGTHGDAAD